LERQIRNCWFNSWLYEEKKWFPDGTLLEYIKNHCRSQMGNFLEEQSIAACGFVGQTPIFSVFASEEQVADS
jgi:hypothetical protein